VVAINRFCDVHWPVILQPTTIKGAITGISGHSSTSKNPKLDPDACVLVEFR
jgi:hypothetical protein